MKCHNFMCPKGSIYQLFTDPHTYYFCSVECNNLFWTGDPRGPNCFTNSLKPLQKDNVSIDPDGLYQVCGITPEEDDELTLDSDLLHNFINPGVPYTPLNVDIFTTQETNVDPEESEEDRISRITRNMCGG